MGLRDYFKLVDIFRPINIKALRVQLEKPLLLIINILTFRNKPSIVRANTVELQLTVTKKSTKLYLIDDYWSLEPNKNVVNKEQAERYAWIRNHNAWAQRYITTISAKE